MPEDEHPYWLNPDFFESVLDQVRSRSKVTITFDDGNLSDYTVALPALMKRGMKAQFFVVADRIGREGYLGTPELRALVSAGMTIGNHGFTHHRWTSVDAERLRCELTDAHREISGAAGIELQEAACPFGSYNRRVLRVLHSCGYRRAYTSDCGPMLNESWLQPRNTITRDFDLPAIERLLALPPAGARALCRRLKLLVKRWR